MIGRNDLGILEIDRPSWAIYPGPKEKFRGARRADLCDGCRALGRPDNLDLKSTTPFGEDKYLCVDRLPTPGAA